MNYTEATQYLDSFINYERGLDQAQSSSFGLERVRALLQYLGNPQENIKFIHVAGTKGKGSTCVFTAYILKEAGYRVGLYTSPHLHEVRERIRILDPFNREEDSFSGKISEIDFCATLDELKDVIEPRRSSKELSGLSYFEILTLCAVVYFAQNKVDFAVLETGLGGRLDATNAIDSLVCGITSIGYEHEKLLGSTLDLIAKEKAAIIKQGNQTVIIAPQPEQALEAIQARCQDMGASYFLVGEHLRFQRLKQDPEKQILDIKGLLAQYNHLAIRLMGKSQAINACTSVGIVESLRNFGYTIDASSIAQGLEKAVWPGRFEIIQKEPLMILDSAHTVESCRLLKESVGEIFPHKKVILVCGISKDKNIRGICQELNELVQTVILTSSAHPRAFRFEETNSQELFTQKEVLLKENVQDALDTALQRARPEDIILVTGSSFVVAEVRELCHLSI
ncbi:MAG: folylpolyglutamate synthase/dihydrofolate synthase family protein [Candidatus Omnitrophota bacterium]